MCKETETETTTMLLLLSREHSGSNRALVLVNEPPLLTLAAFYGLQGSHSASVLDTPLAQNRRPSAEGNHVHYHNVA